MRARPQIYRAGLAVDRPRRRLGPLSIIVFVAGLDRGLAPIGVVLGVVGFVVGLFYLRDAALLGNKTRFLSGVAVLLAAAFAAAWAYLRSPKRSTFLAFRQLSLSTAVAVAAPGLGAAVQALVDYATQYDYGREELRFDQARDWLREHTAPDEVIMSMKDLGFAAGRRYLENYPYIYDKRYGPELLEGKVRELGIHVFVFTENRGQDRLALNPELSGWIAQNTRRSAQFGNYVIYRKD